MLVYLSTYPRSSHDFTGKIQAQLPEWRERIKRLTKDHSEVKVAEVNIGQIVGGMRDIKSLLTDVSS